MKNLHWILLLCFALSTADRADVDVVASGDCSARQLEMSRGMDPTQYRPKVSFRNVDISFHPRMPNIPGCFKIKLRNVEMLEDVFGNISAEFEMRISGTPDPNKEKLRCGSGQAQCGCGEHNPCLYCGFCRNMRRTRGPDGTQVNVQTEEFRKWGALGGSRFDEACNCEHAVRRGQFKVEVTLCTPPMEELEKSISYEDRENLGQGLPLTLFTTIFMYDDRIPDIDVDQISNPVVRRLFYTTPNRRTIGCFNIGSNVYVRA